jgi:3',5'-cyclic-nucleotide phosphodiesterase
MELRVLGCHGGETPRHRTSAFLVGETLAIDAGSLTSGLDLAAQYKLEAVLVSHAHLDHTRDLATIVDNRVQVGAPPLIVAATRATLDVLAAHFFNNLLWPDFTKIPSPSAPGVVLLPLDIEVPTLVAGHMVRAVRVDHTIETCAFIVTSPNGRSLAYSGDTGPTERLWPVLQAETDLRALILEVSFPDRETELAVQSGHLTPAMMERELTKLARPELPVLLFHIKPAFQSEVEKECARIQGANLTLLQLGDELVL